MLSNILKYIDIFIRFKPRKIDGTAHSPRSSKKTAYRGNLEDLEKRSRKSFGVSLSGDTWRSVRGEMEDG